MHIDKIDDLLDKIIDDFYGILINNKKIHKIFGDINFVRYQKDINELFESYTNTIDVKEIRSIIKNNDNIDIVVQLIKRYVAYYTFLMFAFFYKHDKETFINNVVEFSKNQVSYTYKITNFFDSENNSKIISFFQMIKDILVVTDAMDKKNKDKSTFNNLKSKSRLKYVFEFIDNLGEEYVETVFSASSYKKPEEQAHNIIKTLIVLEIYKKTDKQEIFRLMKMTEQEKGEYTFIDIVIPKKKSIDYSSIEDISTAEEIESGYAYELWNYIKKQEEVKPVETVDEKIQKLFNSKLILPITQDFLLYHHDNEKYEYTSNKNMKKKEDTKIKYIINKIDLASELYTPQKDPTNILKIKKSFGTLLHDKRAVTVNNNENVRIITKMLNVGHQNTNNYDYYVDMLQYQTNPYVNFKDFQNYGFSITFKRAIDCVRSVVFEKSGDFKQNPNNNVQMRVGSRSNMNDIVGVIIPSNMSSIECAKVKNLIDMRTLTKDKNGYALTKQLLIDTRLQNVKHDTSMYWLFDLKTDRTKKDKYEQTNKFSQQEHVKQMIGQLYDDVQQYAFNAIKHSLQKTYSGATIDVIQKAIEKEQKKYINVDENEKYADELEQYSYEIMNKTKFDYDVNDDIFYGLSGDIIKLPQIEPSKGPKMPTVSIEVAKYEKDVHEEIIQSHSAICQHHIEWNELSQLRKKEPNKHANAVFDFIAKYVVENSEQNYVCKSCGTYVNINKYILDGKFDDNTQQFITYSTPVFTPLEEIAEYEKYNLVIRGIDKIIDKFSSIVNIPFLIGNTKDVKWKRKAITKDVIDMTILNNRYLKKNHVTRNPKAVKLYGINEKLTNIFVFDLDNSIFVYSSKEKDLYKYPKYNNIVTYIFITIVLELNVNNIVFLSGNKKGSCNYEIFSKYGKNLFDGLKIRKNTDGDLIDINQYPSLCYVLFMMSCMSSLYNMWAYADNTSVQSKKKNHLTIQKMIIHSFVDILNSILENSSMHTSEKTYKIFTTRFYDKLMSVYSDEIVIKRLEESIKKVSEQSQTSNESKISSIKLPGTYEKMVFDKKIYTDNPPGTYFIKLKNTKPTKYETMNNITSCIDGNFHLWKSKGNTLICQLCKADIRKTEYSSKDTAEIVKNNKYLKLHEKAKKYCEDGKLHKIICKNEKSSMCDKCNENRNVNGTFTHSELDFFNDKLKKLYDKQNKYDKKVIKNIADANKKNSEYVELVINKTISQYSKQNSQSKFKFIDEFIDEIQSIVGSTITVNDTRMDILHNTYIIEYDHMGNPIDKIELSEKDNKISLKKNHPVFKTDVLMYVNTKGTKVEVYYDATTNTLLGYKEQNSKLVINNKTNVKLTVNYSLLNKLKYLGYEEIYIKLSNDEDVDFNDIINNVIVHRNKNLKKVMYNFQRLIYRIKNKYMDLQNNDEPVQSITEINKLTQIVDTYRQKLANIKLADPSDSHRIFKHWKAVSSGINPKLSNSKSMDIHDDTKILYASTLNQYDDNNNLILFYIVDNIMKLVQYNDNKFVKINVINMVTEFIGAMFDSFNIEYIYNNFNVKRFKYILDSEGFVYDDEQKGYGLDMYGSDDEAEMTDEQRDQIENINEEADAMDVDPEDLESANENSFEQSYDE